MSKMSDQDQF